MAVEIDREWRKKEESYKEIVKKYPTVSKFIITQIDVQRRGVIYTDKALAKVDTSVHQTSSDGEHEVPESLLLRDGTSICVSWANARGKSAMNQRDKYIVDVVDDRIVLWMKMR
jgi:hypothetical protein